MARVPHFPGAAVFAGPSAPRVEARCALGAFRELEHLVEQEEPEAVLIQQAGLPSRDAALHLVRGLQALVV